MNKSRRKLILWFSIFLGMMLAIVTGLLAYAAHQMQLAQFGDIFDRIVSNQAQTWIAPALIIIIGISIAGTCIFIGLYIYRGKEVAIINRE
jgi:Na+/H+-dicarboxylate symporter